jgi:hypothetical protein
MPRSDARYEIVQGAEMIKYRKVTKYGQTVRSVQVGPFELAWGGWDRPGFARCSTGCWLLTLGYFDNAYLRGNCRYL